MVFDKRAKRVKVRVKVQLSQDESKDYHGITHDLSTSGFSAFLRCKEDFVVNEVLSNAFVQLNFSRMESLFFDREFRAVFNLEAPVEPLTAEVVRVENSWLKGFEVFVACRFKGAPEPTTRVLAGFVERFDTDVERSQAIAREEEEVMNLDLPDGETLTFYFPGRYLYIDIFRDLVERLARQIGFLDLDAFKIKVCADEVFTNAFKHGCPQQHENTIIVKVTLDRKGIFVRVRDEGGVPFDYRKYRDFDVKFPNSSRTGLHLVDKFMDGWIANTKPGESTEVSFYKHRVKDGESR